jgi:hypothetical protein
MEDPVVLRSRRRRQRLIAVLAAGAIAAVVALVQLGRALTPAVVDVKLDPDDATLVVDGTIINGPPPLSVPRGTHQITAQRSGYVSQTQEVTAGPGDRRSLDFKLLVSPDTGLEITSEPEGARIWLDGAPVLTTTGAQAETTYIVTRVRPGKHTVDLKLPPREWHKEIDVKPDKIVPVHGRL